MSIEKPKNNVYDLNQWQSWINQKCIELQIPSLYGFQSIREWMYRLYRQYGWVPLKTASFCDEFNLYDLHAFSYQFLVERSYLAIVVNHDYSEMLEELAA